MASTVGDLLLSLAQLHARLIVVHHMMLDTHLAIKHLVLDLQMGYEKLAVVCEMGCKIKMPDWITISQWDKMGILG